MKKPIGICISKEAKNTLQGFSIKKWEKERLNMRISQSEIYFLFWGFFILTLPVSIPALTLPRIHNTEVTESAEYLKLKQEMDKTLVVCGDGPVSPSSDSICSNYDKSSQAAILSEAYDNYKATENDQLKWIVYLLLGICADIIIFLLIWKYFIKSNKQKRSKR